MSGLDAMSGFNNQGSEPFGDTAPLTTSTTTTQPPSAGSNRDSLNLDDFEKVEADQLFGGPPASGVSSSVGNVADSTQATAVGLVGDIMAQVTNSGQDLFSNFTSTGLPSATETKVDSTSALSDPFKMDDDDLGKDLMAPSAPSTNTFSTDLISSTMDGSTGGSVSDIGIGFTGAPASEPFTSDLLASAPPPPSSNTDLFDDLSTNMKPIEKPITAAAAFDDFLAEHDDKGMQNFTIPDIKEDVKDVTEPLFESFSAISNQSPLSTAVSGPTPAEPAGGRDPSPDFRNPTPPRTPTAPLQELSSPKQPTPPRTPTPPPRESTPPPPKEPTLPPKQPTPPRTPTPPPREHTPPREPTPPPKMPTPREPTPPPREPTPPPREPTPPPKEPTPPPKEPTPPPKEPTPPPKEPTPPPKKPTPPPKEPTPPPKEPTPPPKEPTPPPREPTPPLKEPTPPPKEPTPPPRKVTPPAPRTPTPPPVLVKELPSAPLQEAKVSSPGKSYTVSTSTKNAFNVFKPLVDLIYWRDVKKTGIVFGSLMVILLSLAYLSLISVVAYTSLALLTGTITFRIYKNIMQAVQKSQDGHPFKCILEMDTDLPSDKVHEATDVIVSQINSTVSELKRLFLVEDLVDSVKFGCLLWCLTYLGSWFNGLTLVILAVVALFSLPKVYEQNQAQVDQYVGLVRSQVNDVMSKVKAALPIGNKEKSQ